VHPAVVRADFAYLSTIGRRSGAWHTIEIWFEEQGGTIYVLSGGGDRSDWVRNIKADPTVRIRVGGGRSRVAEGEPATARLVLDPMEDVRARRMLAAKYQGWRAGAPLSDWARTALVVAVDRSEPTGPAEEVSG
jgi:deazaflavin-dependent oxidoreductase (nitroreductase family)